MNHRVVPAQSPLRKLASAIRDALDPALAPGPVRTLRDLTEEEKARILARGRRR